MKHLYLRVIMEAKQTVSLPEFSGSTLRGALNMALKSQSCMSPERCDTLCDEAMSCPYGYLCETPIFDHAPKRLKASRFLPHPLMIHPPVGAQTIEPGGVLIFKLTVLEPALIHLPQLVGALEQMAQDGFGKFRGGLTLRRIEHMDTNEVLYQDGERFWSTCTPGELWEEATIPQGTQLILAWYTPLHLQVKKQMLTTLNVRELLYAAASRLELLWAIYAPEEHLPVNARQMLDVELDALVMVEHQMQQVQHDRWSNRQQHKHTLKGITGHVTLGGELETYWPIFRAAQRVHIGKKTSMSQGAFTCHWLEG